MFCISLKFSVIYYIIYIGGIILRVNLNFKLHTSILILKFYQNNIKPGHIL